MSKAHQVFCLVQQHLRLVLQAGDLIVDLLQRACRLQHVLGIVRWIVDDHLPAGRHWRDDEGNRRRTDQDRLTYCATRHGIASRGDAFFDGACFE
jgi:hypothetical protein